MATKAKTAPKKVEAPSDSVADASARVVEAREALRKARAEELEAKQKAGLQS